MGGRNKYIVRFKCLRRLWFIGEEDMKEIIDYNVELMLYRKV